MSCTRRDATASTRVAGALPIALFMAAVAMTALLAAVPARASIGYELSISKPVLVAGIEFPHGVAVDQVSHRVYVAVVTDDFQSRAPGVIRRFESSGAAAGTFVSGGPEDFFSGVAVNPLTQGFYASKVRVQTPLGNFGTPQMVPFSSAGVAGTPFPLSVTEALPQIATDSSGDVYFPNTATDSVQVFDSAGVLQETIACGACPGGPFGMPVSVAVDSQGDLYVVDLDPDRVVKLRVSAGSYVFDSVLQSGRGAVAVGVDPSSDDVLVGDFPDGSNYHVVAYDSTGSQFDDFGAGLFIDPPAGAIAAAQIAADATTHKLYLTETDKIYVFERVTINPPVAAGGPASQVGQLGATLNATVDARGHAVLECEFEYADEADFLAHEFSNASSLPCPVMPDGSGATTLAVRASGLSPGTDYRYRVTATSNGGSVSSGTQAFGTLPAVPPTVTTEPALSVTQTAATITAKSNPRGGSVSSCQFEFGTSASFGSSLPCPVPLEPVNTAVAESVDLIDLVPGTTYHYRLVVSTNAGTSAGKDVEFTTLSVPSEPGPGATAPPPLAEPIVAPATAECAAGFRRELTGYGDRCVKICKKGFRRAVVRGKVKCVSRKRSSRHPRGHRTQRR